MTTKTLKLVSLTPIDKRTKNKIKDIYATSKNPNGVMLEVIPDYKFAQGDVLYFCDQKATGKYVEPLEVSVIDE